MAHGLETRVPLLDHAVVEFAATMPADVKFQGGQMKHFIKSTFAADLPEELIKRRDKMGFPVPLKEWFAGAASRLGRRCFRDADSAPQRPFFNTDVVLANFDKAEQFSRKIWGLLSLELWHERFHDRAAEFRAMARRVPPTCGR